jgi:hypothetical protein
VSVAVERDEQDEHDNRLEEQRRAHHPFEDFGFRRRDLASEGGHFFLRRRVGHGFDSKWIGSVDEKFCEGPDLKSKHEAHHPSEQQDIGLHCRDFSPHVSAMARDFRAQVRSELA